MVIATSGNSPFILFHNHSQFRFVLTLLVALIFLCSRLNDVCAISYQSAERLMSHLLTELCRLAAEGVKIDLHGEVQRR